MSNAPELRKAILNPLTSGKSVVVNLSGVTYIDSSGIASLVEGYQTARKQSLRFALVDLSEAARKVIHLARLEQVFPIYHSFHDYMSGEFP